MYFALTLLNLVHMEFAYFTLVVPHVVLRFVTFVSSNTFKPHSLIFLGYGIWLYLTLQVVRTYSIFSWPVIPSWLVSDPCSTTWYFATQNTLCPLTDLDVAPSQFSMVLYTIFFIISLNMKKTHVALT